MSKMKILLLTIDVWNDSTNGNNCYTNWFENFDAEFANIYLGPGVPDNNICTKYFQVSDKMMVRSFGVQKLGEYLRWMCLLKSRVSILLHKQ